MTEEERLLEKLRLVGALHAGAATPGERDAAAHAREIAGPSEGMDNAQA